MPVVPVVALRDVAYVVSAVHVTYGAVPETCPVMRATRRVERSASSPKTSTYDASELAGASGMRAKSSVVRYTGESVRMGTHASAIVPKSAT